MGIKYDINTMKLLTLFENITRAKAKDCIEREGLFIFVVQPGEMGKALGKKAINVKKLENFMKKKIRIIEFVPELIGFVSKLVYPNKFKDIKYENGVVTITPEDPQSRGYLIGRGGDILKKNEEIAKRYFPDLKEIKVI